MHMTLHVLPYKIDQAGAVAADYNTSDTDICLSGSRQVENGCAIPGFRIGFSYARVVLTYRSFDSHLR